MKLPEILQAKGNKKITMVTCYDHWSARLLSETDVDLMLVGDSLAMVIYGFNDTTPATMEMMIRHTEAVRRGAPEKFIVSDLPFLSFRKSLDTSLENAGALIQAGANAVKLEGAAGNLEMIERFVGSGIPVMGHLGLTPQFVNALGGFKVQGRTEKAQDQILKDALALEKAGAFAVVLECIPSGLARQVTEALRIPVIGIGAGPDTDGQVLVLQDLLGLTSGRIPKFVRPFADGRLTVKEGIQSYCEKVQSLEFPTVKESYE
jgi:3-methyl-2-oxobutanoate hydroxymethyltransferase